ncbi:MAG: YceI family protein [Deinococcales bacterium]|nr:YceI family protein [Chitinophagaceae bacterium]
MTISKLLLPILLSALLHVAAAQNYTATDGGSNITFTIKNLGFAVDGSFKNLHGNIVFDANRLNTSFFNVTVSAASIDTKNSTRDKHLKKETYFDVVKYPTIAFVSDKIEKESAANTYKVTGKFTIKNKSKIVAFNFTGIPNSTGIQFKGKVNLNRRDFDIGGSSLVLSDNLVLTLEVMAQKK